MTKIILSMKQYYKDHAFVVPYFAWIKRKWKLIYKEGYCQVKVITIAITKKKMYKMIMIVDDVSKV